MLNCSLSHNFIFFFFNDTATTEIYTLSLHDALPISPARSRRPPGAGRDRPACRGRTASIRPTGPGWRRRRDRKSTRLNSSHSQISYAVFCLKKKKDVPRSLERLKRRKRRQQKRRRIC